MTHNLLPVCIDESFRVLAGSVNLKGHSNIGGQEGLRCDLFIHPVDF